MYCRKILLVQIGLVSIVIYYCPFQMLVHLCKCMQARLAMFSTLFPILDTATSKVADQQTFRGRPTHSKIISKLY